MTTATPIRSALAAKPSTKCAPKRAVSFAKTWKYEPPSRRTENSDVTLQPESKQRKYQRRGSKTPAMLFLSKEDLARIAEKAMGPENQQCGSIQAVRRVSLMTALKQNLERSCNLEPTKTLRRMSMDGSQNRGCSTLEILSRM